MTVLSAIQNACSAIALTQPNAVYSSTDREHVELKVLANTCADYIAKDYEWRELKVLATITGTGAATAFSLPSDYDRMLKKAQLWSSVNRRPLVPVPDTDRWLELDVRDFTAVTAFWTLLGSQVLISPAPTSTEFVYYYYMSTKWAANSGGTAQIAFTVDTDTFRLSEKLLELCIIWKWKALKKLPYAQEQSDYEDAKEKLITANKGSRLIRVGNVRMSSGIDSIAYPWNINA